MELILNGGERGIRTPDTVSRIHAFQACSFNHSDISPCWIQNKFRFIVLLRFCTEQNPYNNEAGEIIRIYRLSVQSFFKFIELTHEFFKKLRVK